jgi:hypothetical protein
MEVRAKPSTKDPGQQPTASSGLQATTILKLDNYGPTGALAPRQQTTR